MFRVFLCLKIKRHSILKNGFTPISTKKKNNQLPHQKILHLKLWSEM